MDQSKATSGLVWTGDTLRVPTRSSRWLSPPEEKKTGREKNLRGDGLPVKAWVPALGGELGRIGRGVGGHGATQRALADGR